MNKVQKLRLLYLAAGVLLGILFNLVIVFGPFDAYVNSLLGWKYWVASAAGGLMALCVGGLIGWGMSQLFNAHVARLSRGTSSKG
jgi:hypothetical protein